MCRFMENHPKLRLWISGFSLKLLLTWKMCRLMENYPILQHGKEMENPIGSSFLSMYWPLHHDSPHVIIPITKLSFSNSGIPESHNFGHPVNINNLSNEKMLQFSHAHLIIYLFLKKKRKKHSSYLAWSYGSSKTWRFLSGAIGLHPVNLVRTIETLRFFKTTSFCAARTKVEDLISKSDFFGVPYIYIYICLSLCYDISVDYFLFWLVCLRN